MRTLILAIALVLIFVFVGPVACSYLRSNVGNVAPAPTATATTAQVAPVQQPVVPPAYNTPIAQPVAPVAPVYTQPVVLPTPSTAYGTPPQPQIGHPSLYLETGVPCLQATGLTCKVTDSHTQTWSVPILSDSDAIVGGFTVDGVSGGVYKAQAGPGTITTTVTDGFLLITQKGWSNNEFCSRIGQAVQFNWAHAHESPLPTWPAVCP